MKHDVPAEARAIVDRLTAVDLARPVLDKAAVQRALHQHLQAAGDPVRPIRWIPDAEEALLTAIAACGIRGRAYRIHQWLARIPGTAPPYATEADFLSEAEFEAVLLTDPPVEGFDIEMRRVKPAALTARRQALASVNAYSNDLWRTVCDAVLLRIGTNLRTSRPWPASVARWPLFLKVRGPWDAAWAGAQSAGWAAAAGIASARTRPFLERKVSTTTPMVDAYAAGLWLWWKSPNEIFAVPRPVLKTAAAGSVDGITLKVPHCADGPAAWWPGGARYFFWRGTRVSEAVIMRPETVTLQQILGERDLWVRAAVIDRIGLDRFLALAGDAALIHEDLTGKLYRGTLSGEAEPLAILQTVNPSDGMSVFLRVPPGVRTAREAAEWAWVNPEGWDPSAEGGL